MNKKYWVAGGIAVVLAVGVWIWLKSPFYLRCTGADIPNCERVSAAEYARLNGWPKFFKDTQAGLRRKLFGPEKCEPPDCVPGPRPVY